MANNPPRDHLIKDQLAGSVVDSVNKVRNEVEALRQAGQDQAFYQAQEQVNKIRSFIGSPENILGNPLTKHGEIAEQVEVGIRNARSAVNLEAMTATFEGVGRTARADYLIDGLDVQSKFYNGPGSGSLGGIVDHLSKYSDFTESGGYYHIPKDQYDIVNRIASGEVSGINYSGGELNESTINSIRAKVEEIERRTGLPFNESVKPGISDYSEVQQGAVNDTLDRHDNDIKKINERRKEEIYKEHEASFSEGVKATGIAAGLGGGVALGVSLYGKYREGKNPFKGDFAQKDWAEVGITTAKGAIGGAVAGASLYAMTNYVGMGAPFASSVVSATKGVASLSLQLKKGEINADEFVDLGMIVCSEAAIVAMATVAGQAAIPIPVLGSFVGSLAGRVLAEAATGATAEVAERLEADMQEFLERVDAESKILLAEINSEYAALGSIMEAAFMVELNYGLRERSLALAEVFDVPKEQLIHNDGELDNFMLS